MNSVQGISQADIETLRADLLAHYDAHGRTLPWRIRPEDRARGVVADPYAVWLSEIMLQQTTVVHATPYWEKFRHEFPTVIDLANADRDRVLTLWAGLGYYARARNLHKCAQKIRDEFDGVFPDNEAALLHLPGIGPYTAAAIAAICFNEATNVVDGNVERVIARLFAVEVPLPKGRAELRRLAGLIADPHRPGDYGQAIMDLGAKTCTPRSPDCTTCPWAWACAAKPAGTQTDYPKKLPKKKLPVRYGNVFVLRAGETVLLERRPDAGLLGGMRGFPGSAWTDNRPAPLLGAPATRNWEKLEGTVRHIFTHFELRLSVYTAQTQETGLGDWVAVTDLPNHALPTVMKKVAKLALG